MKKRFICFLILMALLMPINIVDAEQVDTDFGQEVDIQYVNSSRVHAGLTIDGNTAICKAENRMTKDYPSTISMVLQKSKDKTTYTAVKNWNKVYSGVGMKTLSGEETITKGYYYRVKVVVKVYSGSKSIETITVYSDAKKY